MKFKIYVISLPEAIERRKFMLKQLQQLPFEYEIIDAVRGTKLSQEELEEKCDMEVVKKFPNWLNLNAIGCAMSHINAYKKIIVDNMDYALILEDDAWLQKDFLKVINELKNHLNEDKVVLLFTQNIREEFVKLCKQGEIKLIDKYKLNYPCDFNSSTTAIAYIISKKIAINFLDKIYPIRYAADSWKEFYLNEKIYNKIQILTPYIILPYGFDSTIGYSESLIKKILKNLLPSKVYIYLQKLKTQKYIKAVSKYKIINDKGIIK